ncbi:hypothetical protein [Herbidospora mongoliensis]|uniref:hypothetical protein n=1 Tax=Herbidospora mongoliensis TaxID=688067 RepID=UPI00083590E8|nr:hypothetical protein [Herbidospora mongoliensis]
MRIFPVILIVVALTAACVAEPDFPGRARMVAVHWQTSPEREPWTDGLVVLGHLNVEAENPRPKWVYRSVSARAWKSETDLSTAAPAPAELRWKDGGTLTVPLLSADAAFAALTRPTATNRGKCPAAGCRPLRVTKAAPGEATIHSSRGEVTVPTWEFTVEGVTEPFSRIAVDPEAMGGPPRHFGDDTSGEVVTYKIRTPTGLTLTYQHGACDTTRGAHAYETPEVVVVKVDIGFDDLPDGHGCPAIGLVDRIDVTLRQPLGDRVMLDSGSGLPLLPEDEMPRSPGFLTFDARTT